MKAVAKKTAMIFRQIDRVDSGFDIFILLKFLVFSDPKERPLVPTSKTSFEFLRVLLLLYLFFLGFV